MTVADLIEKLQECDPGAEVLVHDSDGFEDLAAEVTQIPGGVQIDD